MSLGMQVARQHFYHDHNTVKTLLSWPPICRRICAGALRWSLHIKTSTANEQSVKPITDFNVLSCSSGSAPAP